MALVDLISNNLQFAISQVVVELTSIPANGESYSASRQDVETAFEVFEDGREVTIDTKFYINRLQYASLPGKGWILTDGTKNYKVVSVHDDSVGAARRLDCASEFQR